MLGHQPKTRILYFIGSLTSGGKERRLIELLTHLKAKEEVELLVVVTRDVVHYPAFQQLQVPYLVIPKSWKQYDLTIFYKFYKICRQFRPDLIHTWGRIQSLYSLPAALLRKVPLINSQITTAPPRVSKTSVFYWLDKLIFHYSTLILSNSQAGLSSFKPPREKSLVIYNGMNPERFRQLAPAAQIKEKYGITTPFAVVMAASFTDNKDYDRFFRVARLVTQVRKDITFIGVGRPDPGNGKYERLRAESQAYPRILFPGLTNEVEALVNACDVGVLFSRDTHGEGLSNAILEYMALGKPVIANDNGGTREILHHHQNGFLITTQTDPEIADLLLSLVTDRQLYNSFSAASQHLIRENFSLDKMGKSFEQVYQRAMACRSSPETAAVFPDVYPI